VYYSIPVQCTGVDGGVYSPCIIQYAVQCTGVDGGVYTVYYSIRCTMYELTVEYMHRVLFNTLYNVQELTVQYIPCIIQYTAQCTGVDGGVYTVYYSIHCTMYRS